MPEHPLIGIIAGSGFTEFNAMQNVVEHQIQTPFGRPSSKIQTGTVAGKRIALLFRHGLGHQLLPSEVNYKANIYAMKAMGVKYIIGVSACGSLRDDFELGHLALPTQLIDHTKQRQSTFFGGGITAYISTTDPFCNTLSQNLSKASKAVGYKTHNKGCLITIEGPRFSTRAESNIFRSWDVSLVNMTTAPEVFLAREAEICYSLLAHITDYDVWHSKDGILNMDQLEGILRENIPAVQSVLEKFIEDFEPTDCEHHHSLAKAFGSGLRKRIPAESLNKLELIIGKYLKKL